MMLLTIVPPLLIPVRRWFNLPYTSDLGKFNEMCAAGAMCALVYRWLYPGMTLASSGFFLLWLLWLGLFIGCIFCVPYREQLDVLYHMTGAVVFGVAWAAVHPVLLIVSGVLNLLPGDVLPIVKLMKDKRNKQG